MRGGVKPMNSLQISCIPGRLYKGSAKKGAEMGYFPFFIDIKGKKALIVGGGKVASRKAEKLMSFESELTVVAPAVSR